MKKTMAVAFAAVLVLAAPATAQFQTNSEGRFNPVGGFTTKPERVTLKITCTPKPEVMFVFGWRMVVKDRVALFYGTESDDHGHMVYAEAVDGGRTLVLRDSFFWYDGEVESGKFIAAIAGKHTLSVHFSDDKAFLQSMSLSVRFDIAGNAGSLSPTTCRVPAVQNHPAGSLPPERNAAVVDKVRPCLNVRDGGHDASQKVVYIVVELDEIGRVISAVVSDETRPAIVASPSLKAFAEAGLRAVKNQRCQPLPLPNSGQKRFVLKLDHRDFQ